MSKCEFCQEHHNRKRENRETRYCSVICIKRAYSVRKRVNKSSRFILSTNKEWLKTETGKGFYWENWAASIFGYENINLKAMNKPYDLIAPNGETFDVKMANLYKRKTKKGKAVDPSKIHGTWMFHREPWNRADYFLCIAVKDGVPMKILSIPNAKMPTQGITVGGNSRYDQYAVKIPPFTLS